MTQPVGLPGNGGGVLSLQLFPTSRADRPPCDAARRQIPIGQLCLSDGVSSPNRLPNVSLTTRARAAWPHTLLPPTDSTVPLEASRGPGFSLRGRGQGGSGPQVRVSASALGVARSARPSGRAVGSPGRRRLAPRHRDLGGPNSREDAAWPGPGSGRCFQQTPLPCFPRAGVERNAVSVGVGAAPRRGVGVTASQGPWGSRLCSFSLLPSGPPAS